MKRIAPHSAHHALARRLAWMAWLLLVLSPLQAGPCAMAGAMTPHAALPAGPAAVAASPAAARQLPNCCDPAAAMPASPGHAAIALCHCALTAGGPLLPAATLAELAPLPRGVDRSATIHVALPGPVQLPPLRPPAA